MLATLAEPSRLGTLAELARRGGDGATLGELAAALSLPAKTVGVAVARLQALGIVVRTGNSYRAKLGELRDAATSLDAANPVNGLLADYPRLKGVFAYGRLVSSPDIAKYGHDLAELAGRAIGVEGPISEAEVNMRLSRICDDVAFMRRLMVDEGVLTRDPSGSVYSPGLTSSSKA
jgi:hypothetical protein